MGSLVGAGIGAISAGYSHAAVVIGDAPNTRVATWGTGKPVGAMLGHGDADGREEPDIVRDLDGKGICGTGFIKDHRVTRFHVLNLCVVGTNSLHPHKCNVFSSLPYATIVD